MPDRFCRVFQAVYIYIMDTRDRVYEIVRMIPPGKVMTYGQIGKITGVHPRQVGRILHQNPDPEKIPCYRVVSSQGKLAENYAFGGLAGQRKRLAEEGAIFSGAKVDIQKCLHKGNCESENLVCYPCRTDRPE